MTTEVHRMMEQSFFPACLTILVVMVLTGSLKEEPSGPLFHRGRMLSSL